MEARLAGAAGSIDPRLGKASGEDVAEPVKIGPVVDVEDYEVALGDDGVVGPPAAGKPLTNDCGVGAGSG